MTTGISVLLEFKFEFLCVYSTFPASCFVFEQCCLNPAPWLITVFVLQLAALSVSFVPIVLQFIVRMFNISISGMPNNACPFPGTLKKLQIFCLLLCSVLVYINLIVLLLIG